MMSVRETARRVLCTAANFRWCRGSGGQRVAHAERGRLQNVHAARAQDRACMEVTVELVLHQHNIAAIEYKREYRTVAEHDPDDCPKTARESIDTIIAIITPFVGLMP